MEKRETNAKREGSRRGYRALCEWIEKHGGKVRLGRAGESFMLVVDAPAGPGTPRAVGYTFADLDELDLHARLISHWLGKVSDAAEGSDAKNYAGREPGERRGGGSGTPRGGSGASSTSSRRKQP